MSTYATQQKFGGQRASVGRIVLLAAPKHDDPSKVCLRAGIVVAVSAGQDRPYIQDAKTGVVDWGEPMWHFRATTSPEEAEALPLGAWTWPPRI